MGSVGFLGQGSCSEAVPLSLGAVVTTGRDCKTCLCCWSWALYERNYLSAPPHSALGGSSGAGMWTSVVESHSAWERAIFLCIWLGIWGELFFCYIWSFCFYLSSDTEQRGEDPSGRYAFVLSLASWLLFILWCNKQDEYFWLLSECVFVWEKDLAMLILPPFLTVPEILPAYVLFWYITAVERK